MSGSCELWCHLSSNRVYTFLSVIKWTKSNSLQSHNLFLSEYKWNKVSKMSCNMGFFPFTCHWSTVNNLDLLSNNSLLSVMLKISSKVLSDLARFAAILEHKLPLWLLCIPKLSLHINMRCNKLNIISTFFTYFSLLTFDISQPPYLPIFLRHLTDYKWRPLFFFLQSLKQNHGMTSCLCWYILFLFYSKLISPFNFSHSSVLWLGGVRKSG